MQDALGGQVQLAVGSEFLVKPHVDSGGVIPLVITTAKRTAALPNVPTVSESGFPGFNAPAWWAVLAPGKTPPAIVDAMNKALNKALKTPAVAEKFKSQGIEEILVDKYDPDIHEVISVIETGEEKIVDIVSNGYKMGDRVVRYPKIIISK